MRSIPLGFLALLALFDAVRAQSGTVPGAEPELVAGPPAESVPEGPALPATQVEIAWLVPAATSGGLRLVPGLRPEDAVESLVSVRFRYQGEAPAAGLRVIAAVPADMRYVADSATGPRVELAYSIDGGESFVAADALPTADEVTHIRWDLPGQHAPGVAGLVAFRARPFDLPADGAGSVRSPGL